MKIPVIIFLILCLPLISFSLETIWDADIEDFQWTVSARLLVPENILLWKNIEEGYRAELHFQLRIYKKNRGILSFLGDKLIISKTYTRIAYKNFFLDKYVIEDSDGKITYLPDRNIFLSAFLNLAKYPVFGVERQNLAEYYFMGIATLMPVILESPLDIVSLFLNLSLTSEPVRIAIYRENE